jgi:hypothetical protein
MSPAMTRTRKQNRSSLRSLDAAELGAATGGIVIYGSTSLGGPDTVGNPEESTTFTGGVYQSLPAIQR